MRSKKMLVIFPMLMSFMVLVGCNKDNGINIQILMTSDVHGFLVPFDYALDAKANGSLSQVATAVKQYKNGNTLLIDCGDVLQGNSADLFLKEDTHPMIEALNLLEYDVFVPGNHEFNYGVDYLTKQLGKFKGTPLCGNVFKKGTKESLAAPYKIFTKNDIKIAVVGMDTHLIKKWDAEKLEDYDVVDPVSETKKVVKEIKDNNLADIIVAAEHIGLPRENGEPGTSARELAEECNDIDVILASHEHKAQQETVNGVLIVENKANAETMAKIDINVKKVDGKFKVNSKTSTQLAVKDFKEDDKINEFAKPFDEEAKKDAHISVGTLNNGPLSHPTEIKSVPATFMEPTKLVNFINTVQKEVAEKNIPKEYTKHSKVKVSSTAIGNYDANLEKEDIRKCDVSHIYKYTNTLYILEMSGLQLKKYLEWSASFYNQFHTGDLTVSFNKDVSLFNYDMLLGIYYEIDIEKAAGSRIKTLKWEKDGNDITDDETFLIAVNNYRANNNLLSYGEKAIYKTKEECPKLVVGDILSGKGIREIIMDYIKVTLNGILDGSKYEAEPWKVIHPEWNKDNRELAVAKINQNPSLIGERNTITFTEKDLLKIS